MPLDDNSLTWGGNTWNDVSFADGHYGDGTLAIRAFIATEYGPEPLTTVTVSLAQYGEYPDVGCVFVKDYAENDGLGTALVQAGYLEPTGRVITLPHGSTVREYKLLAEWSSWSGTDQGHIPGWDH